MKSAAEKKHRALADVSGKIEQLSKTQRILICCVCLLTLVGGYTYFSYYPKIKEVRKLSGEFGELEKKLAKAKVNASQLQSFRLKYVEAEARFKLAMKALPEKEEIPSLLANVSRSGRHAGLEFNLFQPKAEIIKDFYAEIPVSINVQGTYHDVAVFFDKVSRLSRIVNIQNITIKPQKESAQLDTSCTAVTYKFVEKPPEDDTKGKKNEKSRRRGKDKSKQKK